MAFEVELMNCLPKEAGFLMNGARGSGAQVKPGKEEAPGREMYCAVFEEVLCSFVLYLNFAQHFTVCKALLRFVLDLLRER